MPWLVLQKEKAKGGSGRGGGGSEGGRRVASHEKHYSMRVIAYSLRRKNRLLNRTCKFTTQKKPLHKVKVHALAGDE